MNQAAYNEQRIAHWDAVAARWGKRAGAGKYYHRRLARILRFLVPPGLKVLELGCGSGDLLAGLAPGAGVGVDFSPAMIAAARARHPALTLVCADASDLELHDTFDVIILSDLINDVWDAQKVLEAVSRHATRDTRVIMNFYSRVWEMPLRLAQALRLARPLRLQNWLTPDDVRNLMNLSGLEPIRHWLEILLPVQIPLLSSFVNRFLAKLWPLRLLDLSNFIVARIKPRQDAGVTRAVRFGHRPGQERGGQHRGDLCQGAGNGGRDGAGLRRGPLPGRHLCRHPEGDRAAPATALPVVAAGGNRQGRRGQAWL